MDHVLIFKTDLTNEQPGFNTDIYQLTFSKVPFSINTQLVLSEQFSFILFASVINFHTYRCIILLLYSLCDMKHLSYRPRS